MVLDGESYHVFEAGEEGGRKGGGVRGGDRDGVFSWELAGITNERTITGRVVLGRAPVHEALCLVLAGSVRSPPAPGGCSQHGFSVCAPGEFRGSAKSERMWRCSRRWSSGRFREVFRECSSSRGGFTSVELVD